MSDFTLPANIKQIGSIGDGLRIYVEDYVCTFLQQYAESGGYNERLAFLVGRNMVIDGQTILFIAGAIHGKYTEKHEGFMRFSEKSARHAEDVLDEHFSGMEIVGWMQSQPSYGTYLNQHYGAYHLRQFKKPYQVLFVVDPLEKTNAFYMANPSALTPSDRVAEIPGYFIYYEKNTNMHEYMLANKSLDYTAKSPTYVELTPMEYATDSHDPYEAYDSAGLDDDEEYESTVEGRYRVDSPQDLQPEDIIRRHQANKERRKGYLMENKRAVNLLASLCAVLFVVSFVMGVGLIRNQDRIERMEGEMRQLATAHRNLFAQVSSSSGELAPVFAEAPPPQQLEAIEEPPAYEDTFEPSAAVPATQPPAATAPPATTPPQPVAAVPTAPGEQEALIPAIPEAYTIQPGDSLIAISIRFFGDPGMVDEILALNGLDDPDHIVAGRTIALPRR